MADYLREAQEIYDSAHSSKNDGLAVLATAAALIAIAEELAKMNKARDLAEERRIECEDVEFTRNLWKGLDR